MQHMVKWGWGLRGLSYHRDESVVANICKAACMRTCDRLCWRKHEKFSVYINMGSHEINTFERGIKYVIQLENSAIFIMPKLSSFGLERSDPLHCLCVRAEKWPLSATAWTWHAKPCNRPVSPSCHCCVWPHQAMKKNPVSFMVKLQWSSIQLLG